MKRNSGKANISASGKEVEERSLKPPCSSNCRLSCGDQIQHLQRQKILESYWMLGDITHQRENISR